MSVPLRIEPVAEGGLPAAPIAGLPGRVRDAVARRLDLIFVVVLTGTVIGVFYLFPNKIAFLNLFYLPVLTAAYFLGKRKAVLGSVFSALLVFFFALLRPAWFRVESTKWNVLMAIAAWGGFLILTSAAVGSLQERLAKGFEETRRLYEELKHSRVAQEMKEKVEKILYTTMDPVVARLATQGALRLEKREVSVMFTDLSGFTSYSDQNPPDVVVQELNRFVGAVEPIVEMFHGHIDKYMGDGVMVEFGAPVAYDQHALLAVLAGWKLQKKLDANGAPWRLRVGIATGNAILGMIGVRRQAYSAIGDSVNVAKRLEEICQPDAVYVDEATFKKVEHVFAASKVKSTGYGRKSDQELLERLTHLEETLARVETSQVLFEIGRIYFELRDASAAIRHFERALALDPNSADIKVAYADAVLKKDEFEKIQLKGKLRRMTVYQITGFKDRWSDPKVIPPMLAEVYRGVESRLEVSEDVVLGIEGLDGSVGHSRIVSLLSYALAEYLGLTEKLKKTVLLAGYFQDIGKQAVPHQILNRPGSLTEEEFRLVRNHVPESVATLRRMGYEDPQLLEIVGHHHEMWNGKGYPDGLTGEKIPLGARITAVAEAYSALTSRRPYREAWDAGMAVRELRKDVEKGRYDPKVVGALIGLFSAHGLTLAP